MAGRTITTGKYRVFEFPNLGTADVHTVKVTRVFESAKGRVVEYRYNWPFPITSHEFEDKFASWVVEEVA